MQIQNFKLSAIKPYEKNAKTHPDKQVKQIARSISEFGFNQPIVVDKDHVIIVGHGRYFAARTLALSEVPVVVASDLSPVQVAAYRLADNKLNESEWTLSLVIDDLRFLETQGLDITLTGFTNDIFGVQEDDFDAEAEAVKITVPRVKFGQLWALGDHRLYCGDATQGISFDKLMGGGPGPAGFYGSAVRRGLQIGWHGKA